MIWAFPSIWLQPGVTRLGYRRLAATSGGGRIATIHYEFFGSGRGLCLIEHEGRGLYDGHVRALVRLRE